MAPCALVRCGSPATRMALVACGDALAGVTLRVRLASWDYLAGQALLEASGGALLGTAGQRLSWSGTAPADPTNRDFFMGASPGVAQALCARYTDAFSRTRSTS